MPGAAHQHDLANARDDLGLLDHGERQIGQRAERRQGNVAVRRHQSIDEKIHGVRRLQGHDRLGKRGAGEAVGAMDTDRRPQGFQDRTRTAGMDGHMAASGDLADAQRIPRGKIERHVARHRGDGEQVEFRRGEGQQERHRVVLAGIAIDDQGPRRHGRAFHFLFVERVATAVRI